MHIKRFEADTLPEALRQVRESLGPDALVLETRKVGRGRRRFGLAARTMIEVVAATERAAPAFPDDLRQPAALDSRDDRTGQRGSRESSAARRGPDASWSGLRLSRALVAPLEEEMREVRRLLERAPNPRDVRSPGLEAIADELAEIRRLARDLRGESLSPDVQALVAAGLAPRHAQSLARELEAATVGTSTSEALGASAHAPVGASLGRLVGLLGRHIESNTRPPRSDENGALMLVGATGVGKTTTIAKLAAGAGALPHALLSTDVLRLGSDESLQSVAATLGIEFERAEGPKRLERLLRLHGSAPVLVDTSGTGPEDAESHQELRRFREGLGRTGRVQIVISATTKESDLRAELSRFKDLEPEGCIVTRVDESSDLANVVNVLLDEGTPPLTWIGNGRCIPDDLAAADPARLARRVLGAAA